MFNRHEQSPRKSRNLEQIATNLSKIFDRTNYLTELLSNLAQSTSYEEKYAAILRIDERIQKEKSKEDEAINQLIRDFKKEIINSTADKMHHQNWKDAILNKDNSYERISRTFLSQTPKTYDIQEPIELSDKKRFNSSTKKNVCTISGSSFAKKIKEADSNESQESVIVDGSYTASTADGWVLAVAGGCGQHDGIKNENIGRAAYFAAKNACRLMAGYADADILKDALHELKERISAELPLKMRAHKNLAFDERLEKTTLACGRAFRTNNGSFRFVGFNIGDTMLIAYNSRTKKFETIAKARQIIRDSGQNSPAALPNLCNDDELIPFDVSLPSGSIVLGLTNGVWNDVSQLQNSEEDQQKTNRIDIELNFQSLTSDLNFEIPERITVSRLTKAFAEYTINETDGIRVMAISRAEEAQKSERTLKSELLMLEAKGQDVQTKSQQLVDVRRAQQISIGDDYTLVGMLLSNEIDPNPDYTKGEILASVLTLGLYALIKDCLHLGTDDEITITDGFKAAAATFGFFATGSLLGLGYLGYKGVCELASVNYEVEEKLSI